MVTEPISRRAVLGAAVGAAALAPHSADETRFLICDWLGRNWQNERVRFAAGPAIAERLRRGHGVVDDGGAPAPFELVGDGVEVLVDLPPFAQASFGLRADTHSPPTDLTVKETDDLLVLANSHGRVAIRRRLTGGDAPIAGVDRGDGVWVGSTRFAAPSDAVASYDAVLERRGPVAATALCRTRFASGVDWELRVTLQASDPAVLIDERWSQWDHLAVAADFGAGLGPTHLYFRNGAGAGLGAVAFEPLGALPGATVFELEPWLHWWLSPRRGNWFAAWSEHAPKALAVAALRGDTWLTEADIALGRRPEPLRAVRTEGGFELVLPAQGAQRSWLLAMLPPQAIDRTLAGKPRTCPPPQELVIRHGDFPLDRVKDLVLEWPQGGAPRPRLMLTPADLERLKASPPDLGALASARAVKFGQDDAGDGPLQAVVGAYLASGDDELGRNLSEGALAQMQGAVDLFLHQDDLITMGFAPHWQPRILYAAHLADFGLADRYLPAALRERLRAQAAFVAYTVSRPDYWSPARGFSANPSMTSTVAAYQGYLACLIGDHPSAKEWLDASLGELMKELIGWSDSNGGWLEAPHYAMNACEYLLGVGVCARNQGRRELIDHPRLRRVVEWFAKISTPPDARIAGARHQPPIGNTYLLERTGEYGLAAHLWRETDPELSARLEWMHRASGSPLPPYIGGAYPAFAPYRTAFADASLPSAEPRYGSELFPKTGAILRAHFGTDRETQLLMIAGANHEHYDYDSGAVTLWGKGQRIADDFGYTGRAPMSDHSMVDSAGDADVFEITGFTTGERVDYLEGRSGGWQRQILFVKSPDPLGPNYYVIRDRLDPLLSGVWRLWLTGRVSLAGTRALAVGEGDVDTDIALFAPGPLGARLETISRTCSANGLTGAPMTTTQTAVTARLAPGAALTAVVFPRLRTDQKPDMRQIRDDGIFRVSVAGRTDTVILADAPLAFSQAGASFRGRAGALIGEGAGAPSVVVADPPP